MPDGSAGVDWLHSSDGEVDPPTGGTGKSPMPGIEETLDGTPYLVESDAATRIAEAIARYEERVELLRGNGTLTPDTLKRYFGAKRFEQVAESNAIEGSTLTVGETELAISKGVTLTGHDPRFVRDAHSLDKALLSLVERARDPSPTTRLDVHDLHEHIMGEGVTGRALRRVPVRITGARHVPPATFETVDAQLNEWSKWSETHAQASPLLRASVLHAWFVHIHPFADGNGRTARAISTLELIKAGAPPLIIRKNQDRTRYLHALADSDEGDLGPFVELMLNRAEAALTGLENAAREMQGYDAAAQKIRAAQAQRLSVWNTAVQLFHAMLVERLETSLSAHEGRVTSRTYATGLSLEDYVDLCEGKSVTRSWAFDVRADVPGLNQVHLLAWMGYRTDDIRHASAIAASPGPSLFWSKRHANGYPPWVQVRGSESPGVVECTTAPASGDRWIARLPNGSVREVTTTGLVDIVYGGIVNLLK